MADTTETPDDAPAVGSWKAHGSLDGPGGYLTADAGRQRQDGSFVGADIFTGGPSGEPAAEGAAALVDHDASRAQQALPQVQQDPGRIAIDRNGQ